MKLAKYVQYLYKENDKMLKKPEDLSKLKNAVTGQAD